MQTMTLILFAGIAVTVLAIVVVTVAAAILYALDARQRDGGGMPQW